MMNTLNIKLTQGSDLLISLENTAKQFNSFGYILGVIGNLSEAALKCPSQKKINHFFGTLEIISLNGTISPQQAHLHLSISDNNCNVMGGHLVKGSKVLKETDILLGFINVNDNLRKDIISANNVIDIYILADCPWSKRALRLLKNHNINHKTYIISNDNEFNKLQESTKMSIFPQIFLNSKFIGGYDSLIELIKLQKL